MGPTPAGVSLLPGPGDRLLASEAPCDAERRSTPKLKEGAVRCVDTLSWRWFGNGREYGSVLNSQGGKLTRMCRVCAAAAVLLQQMPPDIENALFKTRLMALPITSSSGYSYIHGTGVHTYTAAGVYAGAPAALCRLQVQVQKPLVAPEVPAAARYQTSCSCRPPKGWPLAACRCWRGCCHQCLPEGWSSASLLPHRRPGPHCGRCRLQGRGSNRPQWLARAAYTACMCVGLVSADASKGECRSGSTGRCADFQGYSCMPLTCMP